MRQETRLPSLVSRPLLPSSFRVTLLHHRRASGDEREIGRVPRDDGAGGDDALAAHRDTGNQNRPRADPAPVLDGDVLYATLAADAQRPLRDQYGSCADGHPRVRLRRC